MSNELHFPTAPSMPALLVRAALTRKANPEGAVPAIAATLEQLTVQAEKVARYNAVCGFATDSPTLPATYPHIAAFSLHMEMLLHKSFPFSPMGIVHTRNRIRQYRPIAPNETLRLRAAIEGGRPVDAGLEVDIVTEAHINGELVWDDLTTVLKRGKSSAPKRGKKRSEMPQYSEREDWNLAANLGRRYARVSGDYNPIHLFPASAKLMGFKRHIAHGMWSKARCLAALQGKLASEAFDIDVEFKTPLFLPADVGLHYEQSTDGVNFSLRNAAGNRPHLNGSLKAL